VILTTASVKRVLTQNSRLVKSETTSEHHQILRELATDNWPFTEAWSDLAHDITTHLIARRRFDWCSLAHIIHIADPIQQIMLQA
jgi:hypothetical protein